jgi:N-carbamoyl-L-amino-acid hydrolase
MMNLSKINSLQIDPERLWRDLERSSKIGPGKAGGLRRLALSDEDKEMRGTFIQWCKQAGCTVRIDPAGNIFARRPGRENSLPAVLVGSHLDTQIAGGKYDGVLGVLSALEVVRTLNDGGVETRRPIEIVSWTNEEGARFQPPMMGSGAFAGVHNIDWVLAQRDEDGDSFGAELSRIGYAGTEKIDPSAYDSYFELHIEQGPALEEQGLDVGIVTGGFTSFGAQLIVEGETAHTGSTPMDKRRNALVGASFIISSLEELGWANQPDGRTACSRIDVLPNKYGIIPNRAEITIDVRHSDPRIAEEMFGKALALVPQVQDAHRLRASVAKEWTFGGVSFDTVLINLVRTVSADLGVSHKHMLSAAGHDAYHLSKVMPTALIFTPCKDGITHNESEHIEQCTTSPGVNVLLHSVIRRANS